jgi:hypothetical protein
MIQMPGAAGALADATGRPYALVSKPKRISMLIMAPVPALCVRDAGSDVGVIGCGPNAVDPYPVPRLSRSL